MKIAFWRSSEIGPKPHKHKWRPARETTTTASHWGSADSVTFKRHRDCQECGFEEVLIHWHRDSEGKTTKYV